MPKDVQTKKYPVATASVSQPICDSPRNPAARRYSISIGRADGSIIATIIASHIPTNTAAAESQVWPGIVIHIILMVQLPGIRMPPDIDRVKIIVRAAATTKPPNAVAYVACSEALELVAGEETSCTLPVR